MVEEECRFGSEPTEVVRRRNSQPSKATKWANNSSPAFLGQPRRRKRGEWRGGSAPWVGNTRLVSLLSLGFPARCPDISPSSIKDKSSLKDASGSHLPTTIQREAVFAGVLRGLGPRRANILHSAREEASLLNASTVSYSGPRWIQHSFVPTSPNVERGTWNARE